MSFETLVEDLRQNQLRSPWAHKQGIAGWAHQVELELVEVMEEINAPVLDKKHLGEELGDVLGDLLLTVISLQDAGGPTVDEVVEGARVKLRRRKPWIFDDSVPAPATAEEEDALYLALKARGD